MHILLLGIYRVRYFMEGHTLNELWRYPSFIVLSILQKSGIFIIIITIIIITIFIILSLLYYHYYTIIIITIIISIYTILFIKFTRCNKIIRTNIF
jgi:hypothetical protein